MALRALLYRPHCAGAPVGTILDANYSHLPEGLYMTLYYNKGYTPKNGLKRSFGG